MKNIIKILLVTLVLYSCKKEKEPITPIDRTLNLTGKIVLNCAGNPVANRNVELYVVYGAFDLDILNVKTDSNGNFEWSFEPRKGVIEVVIRPAGLGDILSFSPYGNEELGTIIANPTVNVVMKIKVNSPYNVGDPLRLKDFVNHPSKSVKIAAPFRDTILTTAYNYSELNWPGTFEQKNTNFVQSNIFIYNGVNGSSSLQVLYDRWIDDRFPSCTNAVDTLYVEIN